jgi:CheY-like chemotaxis protein
MVGDIITWFKGIDWLANAFGVGVPVGGGILLLRRWCDRRKQPRTFQAFVADALKSPFESSKLKGIATIGIVDDNLSDFPVGDLKKAGFNIKTYKHVTIADFDLIAKFDVVFLDMRDIVKDDPMEGGLKLIHTLRQKNPRQKICAVSSKKFDPAATAFFKQADDVQNKPISAHKCQQVIHGFLQEKFDPRLLAESLDSGSAGPLTGDSALLLQQVRAAVQMRKALDDTAIPHSVSVVTRSLAIDLARALSV